MKATVTYLTIEQLALIIEMEGVMAISMPLSISIYHKDKIHDINVTLKVAVGEHTIHLPINHNKTQMPKDKIIITEKIFKILWKYKRCR
jgi:hypothetical protein